VAGLMAWDTGTHQCTRSYTKRI